MNIYEYIHFQRSRFPSVRLDTFISGGFRRRFEEAAGESGPLASYLKSPPRAFPIPERKRIRLIKDTECEKRSTGPKPAVSLVSGRGSSESVSIDSYVKTAAETNVYSLIHKLLDFSLRVEETSTALMLSVGRLLKNVSGGTQRTFLLFTC